MTAVDLTRTEAAYIAALIVTDTSGTPAPAGLYRRVVDSPVSPPVPEAVEQEETA